MCGTFAALNIWFFIGLTIFQHMGNPYLCFKMLGFEWTEYNSPEAK